MEGIKHYKSEEKQGIAEGHKYTEQELAVNADKPLIDSASGKKVIIRVFDFEWKKGMKTEDKMNAQYNKQALFNAHAKMVRDFLWKDGLSILENEDPKLNFTKTGYRIAVACEARFGVSIFEKGSTLQDILKKKKKK